jgi:hypothetical protein
LYAIISVPSVAAFLAPLRSIRTQVGEVVNLRCCGWNNYCKQQHKINDCLFHDLNFRMNEVIYESRWKDSIKNFRCLQGKTFLRPINYFCMYEISYRW